MNEVFARFHGLFLQNGIALWIAGSMMRDTGAGACWADTGAASASAASPAITRDDWGTRDMKG